MTMVRSFLEATDDRFDWFFHARVDDEVVPSLYQALWLSFCEQNVRVFCHFHIVVDFGNFEKKVQNIRGLEMVVF